MNIEPHATCNFDKLKIYDGLDASAALINTYCEETPPDPDYTTNNMAYLTFTSDASVSGEGFTINYLAIDSAGGEYNQEESAQEHGNAGT